MKDKLGNILLKPSPLKKGAGSKKDKKRKPVILTPIKRGF